MRGILLTMAALAMSIPAAQAVSPEILQRGWKPSVEMIGDGEPAVAIHKLREVTDLQRVVLHNTEYHEQTQAFVDGLWASLERFDLRRFYSLLPEETGDWRQLRVYGSRQGTQYRMGPEASILGNDHGELRSLGDVSVLVKARPVEHRGNYNYLLSSTMTVGVGEVQWPSVLDATEETFRIVVEGDENFQKKSKFTPDFRFQAKVHAMNPELGEEDVAIIAPLWAAFPEMWDLLAALGQVQEVVVDSSAKDYRHLQATFQVRPAMMKKRYPELAGHLDNLSSLLKFNMDISNPDGRVLRLSMNSEDLTAHVEGFVKDGRLLPVQDGKVLVDAPTRWRGRQALNARIDATMSILGIVTHMTDVRADILYEESTDGATVTTRVNQVPQVEVAGYALGVMPTGLVNFFIPRSIDELMLEFLQVACQGNQGKGVVARMRFENGNDSRQTQVHFTSEFEGLDNFMVRIGMGIVSDRIIPDTDVSDDLRRLVFDTQDAFSKDLDGFARVALR
ncbi:MAG: hypothetical protein R3208_02290 [Ketobacteraceae bacterium]|nr:hypothetical protein [Ketobacteraceae bacterium]